MQVFWGLLSFCATHQEINSVSSIRQTVWPVDDEEENINRIEGKFENVRENS